MKQLNVACITDANYKVPTLVLIQSILNHKDPDVFIDVFVLYTGLAAGELDLFYQFIELNQRDDFKVHLVEVPGSIIERNVQLYNKCHPKGHGVGVSTLIKFSLWQILSDIDDCLYLDTDIIAREDLYQIKEYFDAQNEDGTKLAGASVIPYYFIDNFIRKPKAPPPRPMFSVNKKFFFNAGVMYLNLKALRNSNATEDMYSIKTTISNNDKMMIYRGKEIFCGACDQDTFNLYFDYELKHNMVMFPIEYNMNATDFVRLENRYRHLTKEEWSKIDDIILYSYDSIGELYFSGVLYHYTSKMKPWKPRSTYDPKLITKNFLHVRKFWWDEFDCLPESIKNKIDRKNICGEVNNPLGEYNMFIKKFPQRINIIIKDHTVGWERNKDKLREDLENTVKQVDVDKTYNIHPEDDMFYSKWRGNEHHWITSYCWEKMIPFLFNLFDLTIDPTQYKFIQNEQNGFDVSYHDKIDDNSEYSYTDIVTNEKIVGNHDVLRGIQPKITQQANLSGYHLLFSGAHRSCLVTNSNPITDKKLFINADSMIIPFVPILAYYFKEIMLLDNRERNWQHNKINDKIKDFDADYYLCLMIEHNFQRKKFEQNLRFLT